MSLPWKILLALAVALPLGGFVAGSLASTARDEPPARQPIVIEHSPTTPPPLGPTGRAEPTPDADGRDDEGGRDEGVEVITPQPYEDDGGGDDDAGAGDGDHGGDDDEDDDGDGDDDGGDD